MLLRRLNKSKSLRIVNLLGLSVIFCCLVLSFVFIKKELSYDRFHTNADRIVRFSVQYNNEPIDGRNYGFSKSDPEITGIAGIEDAVFMNKIEAAVLNYRDKPYLANNLFSASSNFFEVFSFKLLEGNSNSVLDAPEKVVISRQYARSLFGEESPIGKEIELSSHRLLKRTSFISGVFEDFPENSHFKADIICHRSDSENKDWAYIYLLLDRHSHPDNIAASIATKMDKENTGKKWKVSPYLIPLTDIHLHSRILRELGANGNIVYLYLIAGANLLLLIIVLFNLWLNAGLIFSFNQKYYQLLRLNGASSWVVLRDEGIFAILLGLASILTGGVLANFLLPYLNLSMVLPIQEISVIGLSFLLTIVIISVLPAITRMSSTLFRYDRENLQTANFTLSKVKYMLIAQYGIVMLVVIIGFGISKQINMIKTSQVGGNKNSVLVMDDQPADVKERYEVLKNELQKHPEIKAVTSAMQLPGKAIRDAATVRVEEQSDSEMHKIPLLVVGDDFLSFFKINPIAGTVFQPSFLSYSDEDKLFKKHMGGNSQPTHYTEEYLINRKALALLGFSSPEEAIGKTLQMSQGSLNYIERGKIVGVTEDFNYTTTFEESIPQLLMQRKMFQHCIMVELDNQNMQQSIAVFNQVWNKINPDYPADYTFLQNVYADVYHNELKAESLVRIFSLLCLIVANLGLIIITSFVIRRKTKEIGVRKVNGATPMDIIRLLNNRFVIWIGIAFVVAIPCAYLIMQRWLEHFAHKVQVDGWIYAFAGLLVLSLSMISVSWQSWQAAMMNPIKALKME